MIPPSVRWSRPASKYSFEEMTEAPELSMGGGGSVTMMSNFSSGELEVVAAIRDDHTAIGVREDGSQRPRSTTRTSSERWDESDGVGA